MAIDLRTETIIVVIRQALPLLGVGRSGKPPHESFLVRAIKKGINGHRLEALRVGSRWVTSFEAVRRRLESQNPDLAPSHAESPAAGRRKAAERAGRELDRLGI
jgi:hypothetical protein